MKSVFLDTLNGKSTSRRPVWFMRQAGRYLPEYRAVRAQAGDFLSLCANPELSAEVTCQPVELLGVDAGIIFSDILVIPAFLGLDLQLVEGIGPVFPHPMTGIGDLISERREFIDPTYEAIRLATKRLWPTPLIGFCGSPWTLLAYMVEGQGSKTFTKAKTFLAERPEEASAVLDLLTTTLIRHLRAQVEAGCQVVQVFDTWGGLLDSADFKRFSLPGMQRIARELEGDGVPVISFCKGVSDWETLLTIPSRGFGVGWNQKLSTVRNLVGAKRVLQGNLDPAALCGPAEAMETKLRVLIADHGSVGPHVINLGHGVTPDARVDTVKAFVSLAKELSTR